MKKGKIDASTYKNSFVFALFSLLALASLSFYFNSKINLFGPELILAIFLTLTIITYLYIRKYFLNPLKKLKKAVNSAENKEKDEVQLILESHQKMQNNINSATDFIQKIKKGELDDATLNSADDALGSSLLSMREHLKKISAQEKERIWSSEGLATFSDLLRANESNLNALSLNVLSHLIKYIKANQGALFIIQDNEDSEEYMELAACYAYNRKKYLTKKIVKGEGLVGQAWIEKDKVYLTEVPQNYIDITSGLGNANPGCILIVPLKVNEEIYGILELASFSIIPTYQIEFIEKLAENLASTISMVKVNERTRLLLEESQELTEQMRAQEEEMRQNLEELTATQEELQRKEGELERELQKALKEVELGQINQQMNEIALQIEHIIDSSKRDLKFLSNVPPVQGLLRAIANNNFDELSNSSYEDWIERMDTIFRNFLINKELFQSITFTNEKGRLIFRLAFNGKELTQCLTETHEDPQTFEHVTQLRKGEVYVGQTKLLAEGNLVMEFGGPVYNEDNQLKGTILLNLFAETIIEGIKAKENEKHKYTLYSSEGLCVFGNEHRSKDGLKKQVVTNKKQNLSLTIMHQ